MASILFKRRRQQFYLLDILFFYSGIFSEISTKTRRQCYYHLCIIFTRIFFLFANFILRSTIDIIYLATAPLIPTVALQLLLVSPLFTLQLLLLLSLLPCNCSSYPHCHLALLMQLLLLSPLSPCNCSSFPPFLPCNCSSYPTF